MKKTNISRKSCQNEQLTGLVKCNLLKIIANERNQRVVAGEYKESKNID